MRTRCRQSGFTLVELITAVFVLGVLAIAIAPILNSYVVSVRGAYVKKQELNNQALGAALLQYAQDATAHGQLPTPYTGGGLTSTVYDPTGAPQDLKDVLRLSGLNPAEINNDNYPSQRVRVFQRADGLQLQVPLYFQSGPGVVLTYQYGAIYMTECERRKSSCIQANGIPGTSQALTQANFRSWTTEGTDLAPFFISTLPLQKQMLADTARKLDRIRDAMLSYFRAKQLSAPGNDETNWFPAPTSGMGGKNPASNQGCRDGWYDLAAATSLLPLVGLTVEEYGRTAWSGAIQYCRDYDADGSSGEGKPPHFAAIRINRDVSSGNGPTGSNNDVVLTF